MIEIQPILNRSSYLLTFQMYFYIGCNGGRIEGLWPCAPLGQELLSTFAQRLPPWRLQEERPYYSSSFFERSFDRFYCAVLLMGYRVSLLLFLIKKIRYKFSRRKSSKGKRLLGNFGTGQPLCRFQAITHTEHLFKLDYST